MEKDKIIQKCSLLVIGGSAGSLEVILYVLANLDPLPFPIVVILHRRGSSESLLSQVIGARSVMPVEEAEEKQTLRKGRVYVAPANYHLLFEKDGTVSLDDSEKVHFSRPSIDVSFASAASVYGPRVTAILLSGGNADGTDGLTMVSRAGGRCLIQDPGTAAAPFMPASAASMVPVEAVLQRDQIVAFLRTLD